MTLSANKVSGWPSAWQWACHYIMAGISLSDNIYGTHGIEYWCLRYTVHPTFMRCTIHFTHRCPWKFTQWHLLESIHPSVCPALITNLQPTIFNGSSGASKFYEYTDWLASWTRPAEGSWPLDTIIFTKIVKYELFSWRLHHCCRWPFSQTDTILIR